MLSGSAWLRATCWGVVKLARSHCILPHLEAGFLAGLSGLCLWVSQTAQFNWMIPSFDYKGRPCVAGPGLSATYHWMCRPLECLWPFSSHLMAVSRAQKCGMLDPLYAVRLVSEGQRPIGLLVEAMHLGNTLAKTWSGITLPPAAMSPLHIGLPHFFYPTSAGRLTVAQVWVIKSMLTSVIQMESWSVRASEAMVSGGAIVAEWAFWATWGENILI